MRLLHPGAGIQLEGTDAHAAAYRYPDLPAGRVWLRAAMISSIDGAAQGPDGRSGTLSTPPDRYVFALMRALADVILVGAGTVRAEGYGPAEPDDRFATLRSRAGQPPAAPIAVVSRSLDLDPEAAIFTRATEMTGSAQRTIVFTVEDSPPETRSALASVADVVVVGDQDVDVAAVRDELSRRGLCRIVCEGGPHLLTEAVRTDQVDELCHTIAPVIAGGSALHMLAGAPVDQPGWELAHLIEEDGTLLTRWLRPGSRPRSATSGQPPRTAAMS